MPSDETTYLDLVFVPAYSDLYFDGRSYNTPSSPCVRFMSKVAYQEDERGQELSHNFQKSRSSLRPISLCLNGSIHTFADSFGRSLERTSYSLNSPYFHLSRHGDYEFYSFSFALETNIRDLCAYVSSLIWYSSS